MRVLFAHIWISMVSTVFGVRLDDQDEVDRTIPGTPYP